MKSKLITTFKEYKESYPIRLEKHKSQYEDYDELHFIETELEIYKNCLNTATVTRRLVNKGNGLSGKFYSFTNKIDLLNEDEIKTFQSNSYPYELHINPTFKNNPDVYKLIFNENLQKSNNYDLETCERLSVSFTKIKNYLNKLKSPENKNPHPEIFEGKDSRAYNLFKDFADEVTDDYPDYSFIFQKMKKQPESLIKKNLPHKIFMDWLFQNRFIKKQTYDTFIIEKSFSTKYDTGNRTTRYYTVKKRYFPTTSD